MEGILAHILKLLGFWLIPTMLIFVLLLKFYKPMANYKVLSFIMSLFIALIVIVLVAFIYDGGEALFVNIYVLLYVLLDGKGPG